MINKPSPNFSSRNGLTPKYICIHIMQGSLTGTDDWFSRSVSQVSAHYGIGLTGETHQYVDEKMSAWANGRVDNPTAQIVKDNLNVNQNAISLSIEHEGQDLSTAPQAQLNASAQLIKSLCSKWNIPLDRNHILGHYEIYLLKPNCPSTDKSIIDKLISLAVGQEELVNVQVPKSKLLKIQQFLNAL